MQLNYFAILLATVLQFICGALWFTVLFGNLWGKMHGFDKLSKAVQEKMMAKMGPFYLLQFVTTLVTTVVLALFMKGLPEEWNPYGIAGFFWFGFILPTQISAVVFGGTEPKWMTTKIAIQAGSSLLCLEVAAAVLHFMR